MTTVVDFSGTPPRNYPTGCDGAVRYIAPRRSDGSRRPKCITPAELTAHRQARRSVGFVYEDSANNSLGGARQGDVDGRVAVAEMLALGVPRGVACYAAVDRDITPTQLPTVAAYLDAFHRHSTAAGYRRGVYGEYDVVVTMLRDGHAELGWQTVAWSSRKRAEGVPGVALYQRAQQITVDGTVCDVNDVWADDWGQWPSTHPTPHEEDDMYTDADRQRDIEIHAALTKDTPASPSIATAVAQTYYRTMGLEPGKGLVSSLIGKIAGKVGVR